MGGAKLLVGLTAALAALAGASWWLLRGTSADVASSVSAREPAPPPRDAAAKRSEVSDPDLEPANGAEAASAPEARASDATPTADEIATRANELAALAESFRTATPDVDALRRVATELAAQAVVDEASVATDEEGVRHGSFAIRGTALRGTFAIADGRYRVSVPIDAVAGPVSGFTRTELVVAARDELGAARDAQVALRSDPDRGAAPGAFAGERIVGWSVEATSDGSVAQATSAERLEDGAWRIGAARSTPPIARPGDRDARASEAWLAKLRPFADAR